MILNPSGRIITTTPQLLVLDPSKRYSFLHSKKADTAGAASTSIIFFNEIANSFNGSALFQATDGYWWLDPTVNLVLNHAGNIHDLYVRTDTGTAILLIAPDWKDNS